MDAKLEREFIHTEERLKGILKILDGNETDEQKLEAVHWEIFQLASAMNHDYVHNVNVSAEIISAVAKRLFKSLQAVWPTMPQPIVEITKKVTEAKLDQAPWIAPYAIYHDAAQVLRDAIHDGGISAELAKAVWTTSMFTSYAETAATRMRMKFPHAQA